MSRTQGQPPRAALALLALAVIVLGTLGMVWYHSRHAGWETPRWWPERFVAIRVPPRRPPAAERQVVAINPRCPHCATSLAAAAERQRRRGGVPRVVALIVDTPRRPDPGVVAAGAADEVYWDAAGVWRHRWGHRIYGETLVFAPNGLHLETLPPAVAGRSGAPASPSGRE